jgi:transcriptional regulator with XRE-family HTH domain
MLKLTLTEVRNMLSSQLTLVPGGGSVTKDRVRLTDNIIYKESALYDVIQRNYEKFLDEQDRRGVKQQEVASRIGRSDSLISQMKNRTRPLEIDTLEALAQAFNRSPLSFFQTDNPELGWVCLPSPELNREQNFQLFRDLEKIREGLILRIKAGIDGG